MQHQQERRQISADKGEGIETCFTNEVSAYSLNFVNPEMESKYGYFKLYQRFFPSWFKWVVWTFAMLLIIRRIQLLIYSMIQMPSSASAPNVEIVILSSFIGTAVIEMLVYVWKKAAIIRGLIMLLCGFFTIGFTAYSPSQLSPGVISL